ncbi:MAG: response regulator [Myxococcota bacterium]
MIHEALKASELPPFCPYVSIPVVLIVDDEPDIRLIGELSLREIAGWTVHLAESGLEAVSMVPKICPDILLLDVMMPELDGPSTLLKLRELEMLQNCCVIFLTAKAQTHEVQRYLDFGAAGVIPKPFDPIKLPELIREFMAEAA